MPIGVRLAFTAWMLVWVPLYWRENGWTNFLWLCDFANFATLVAIWRGSALLASSQLAGVLLIQTVWAVDFFGRLLTGTHPVGGTEYMFDAGEPLWLRGLSLFHLWTVPLLFWLVGRLGHDRRGLRLEAGFATLLVPAGMLLGTREQNLNWIWAPFGIDQTWMPPAVWCAVLVVAMTFVLFLPGDLLVRVWMRRRAERVSRATRGTAPRRPPQAAGG